MDQINDVTLLGSVERRMDGEFRLPLPPDVSPNTGVVSVDGESRSALDLTKVGSHLWAQHPTHRNLCVALHITGEPFLRGYMRRVAVPPVVFEALATQPVAAWNAGFERDVSLGADWQAWGLPEIPVEHIEDSMARAAAVGLPQSLDQCAKLLGVGAKDAEGYKLMRRITDPKTIEKIVSERDADRLLLYCFGDVLTEMRLRAKLPPLDARELSLWRLHQRINERGLRVDRRCLTAVQRYVETRIAALDAEMAEVTGGVVKKATEVTALKNWLGARGVGDFLDPSDQKEDDEDGTVEAAEQPPLRKQDINDLLLDSDLQPDVRRVLAIRQEAGSATVRKLSALLRRSDDEDVLRGAYRFSGAHTGRWSSTGAQMHNMARLKDNFDQAKLDALVEAFA